MEIRLTPEELDWLDLRRERQVTDIVQPEEGSIRLNRRDRFCGRKTGGASEIPCLFSVHDRGESCESVSFSALDLTEIGNRTKYSIVTVS